MSQAVTVVVGGNSSAPAITSFTATPSVITLGQSTTLTPGFINGTGSIDNDIGDVTSGVGVTLNPNTTTTYTLTVTGYSGTQVSQIVTVDVHDGSSSGVSSYTANPAMITVGESSTIIPTFSGGTAVIDNGIGQVTSGVGIVVSPTGSTIYKLTFTSDLGFTESRVVTVTVNGLPAP